MATLGIAFFLPHHLLHKLLIQVNSVGGQCVIKHIQMIQSIMWNWHVRFSDVCTNTYLKGNICCAEFLYTFVLMNKIIYLTGEVSYQPLGRIISAYASEQIADQSVWICKLI